jgi:hypothetical protein
LAFTGYDSGEEPGIAYDVRNVWSSATVSGINSTSMKRTNVMTTKEWMITCGSLVLLTVALQFLAEYGAIVIASNF